MKYYLENKVGMILLGIAILIILCSLLLMGCHLNDVVKVQVPPAIQKLTNIPETSVSLSQAPYIRRRYITEVSIVVDQFDQDIEEARAFRDLLASLLNTGLSFGNHAAASTPLGAIAFTILGGLGGLFLDKPGSKKKGQK